MSSSVVISVVVSLPSCTSIENGTNATVGYVGFLVGLPDVLGRVLERAFTGLTVQSHFTRKRRVALQPHRDVGVNQALNPGGQITGNVTYDAPKHGTLTFTPDGSAVDTIEWKF